VQSILEIRGNVARCPECRGQLGRYTFWESFCTVFCAEKLEGVDLVVPPKELVEEIEKRSYVGEEHTGSVDGQSGPVV
jgi:hypothetical protein